MSCMIHSRSHGKQRGREKENTINSTDVRHLWRSPNMRFHNRLLVACVRYFFFLVFDRAIFHFSTKILKSINISHFLQQSLCCCFVYFKICIHKNRRVKFVRVSMLLHRYTAITLVLERKWFASSSVCSWSLSTRLTVQVCSQFFLTNFHSLSLALRWRKNWILSHLVKCKVRWKLIYFDFSASSWRDADLSVVSFESL